MSSRLVLLDVVIILSLCRISLAVVGSASITNTGKSLCIFFFLLCGPGRLFFGGDRNFGRHLVFVYLILRAISGFSIDQGWTAELQYNMMLLLLCARFDCAIYALQILSSQDKCVKKV